MRRTVFLGAAAAGTLLLGVPAAQASSGFASVSAHAAGVVTVKNDYWTGYVATARNGKGSKYVTATFTVPALNCATTPASSVYHFVGLGGYTDGDINAAGLDESCSGPSNPTPTYQGAIWEPGAGPNVVMTVSPGDLMSASVYYDQATAQDQFIVKDRTSGVSFSGVNSCTATGCGISTAEVVTQGNARGLGTADFGAINFITVKLTPNGVTGSGPLTTTKWNITQLVQYGVITGQVDVQPSALTSTTSSSSFSNSWERRN
jgi:hypothetical protein